MLTFLGSEMRVAGTGEGSIESREDNHHLEGMWFFPSAFEMDRVMRRSRSAGRESSREVMTT